MNIYTIGHYNNTKEQLLHLLNAAQIEWVVDVRAFPGSRKFPWFSRDAMPHWLEQAGIGYRHIPELGGRRQTTEPVSPVLNGAWHNQSFHNYADYTLSDDFQIGIDKLTALARDLRTVILCAERHPARCHRLLISNWLAARNWDVIHLIPDKNAEAQKVSHVLGKWGAMPIIEADQTVVYPDIN